MHYKRSEFYKRSPRVQKIRTAICQMCGMGFAKAADERRMTTCSTRCLNLLRAFTQQGEATCEIPWKKCPVCAATFIGRSSRKYCSQQCATRAIQQGHEASRGLCRDCGDAPPAKYSQSCDPCLADRKAATRRRNKVPSGHVARAKRFGVHHQYFKPASVYERDGWQCGICHQPIDRTLHHPDRMSVSLDHVVPLSRGGSHTPDNCQAAHWWCNVLKGNAVHP